MMWTYVCYADFAVLGRGNRPPRKKSKKPAGGAAANQNVSKVGGL